MRKLIGNLIGVLFIVAGSVLALLAIVSHSLPFSSGPLIGQVVLFSSATIAFGALLIRWSIPRKPK